MSKWIGGDFNLPDIDWANMTKTSANTKPAQSEQLISWANDHLLTQVVTCTTRKNNILDLFFTNTPSLVNRSACIPPLGAADHDIVFIDINTRAAIPKRTPSTRLQYHKADWAAMSREAEKYVVPNGNIQHMWDSFEKFHQSLIDKFVPSCQSKPPKQKPWVTTELKSLFNKRDRAHRKARETKSENHKKRFLKLRQDAQRAERSAYKAYTDAIFGLNDTQDASDRQNITKRFWSFIKSKRKDTCGVSPLRDNGLLISDAKGKANILNNQYSSVFTDQDGSHLPPLGPSPYEPAPDITVTPEGVEKLLARQKPNKASGPDKISPLLLKNLAKQLAAPLASIFQASRHQGQVPRQWKDALVSPIFKKGDKHSAANYRPVSLTSVCCKICEHIIAKSLMVHLENNEILTDSQHGFRAKRSCETQLLSFIDELHRSVAKGKQIDLAILDFSKAFDVVPHNKLLHKLAFYGIKGSTLCWIRSFLGGRTQRVVVDDAISEDAPVTSGVPQGSVLGPILFLTFINDMPAAIKSHCRLFADDSIVYKEIIDMRDCASLQEDLDRLHKWETDWGMSFNPSKCNTMSISRKPSPTKHPYSLKGVVLESVDVAPYLGVNISSDLSWHSQVKKVAAKANRSLGFIKRNLKGATVTTKALAFQALVRPQLEYCSTVWSPHQQNHIYSLEMVQRRAARFVLHRYGHQSVTDMLNQLNWETLVQRRLKAQATMIYKINNNLVCIPTTQLSTNRYNTRSMVRGGYVQLRTTTNYHKFSFFPVAIRAWNILPADVTRSTTLEQFKAGLKQITIDVSKIY